MDVVTYAAAVGKAKEYAESIPKGDKGDKGDPGEVTTEQMDAAISEAVSPLSGEIADEVATRKSEVAELTRQLAEEKRSNDAQWKLMDGQVCDFQEQTQESYQEDVLSGSEYANIEMLGGKSVVWNQISQVSQEWNNNGVTYKSENGLITISGTATSPTYKGFCYLIKKEYYVSSHKYICLVNGDFDNDESKYVLWDSETSSTISSSYVVNKIFTPSAFLSNSSASISFIVGCAASGIEYNDIFYVNCFDLTQMFGAGNEPSTVEEFRAMFPNDYYEYDAGTIVSMDVDEVVSVGADGTTEMGARNVPTGLNLKSASSAYDYVDVVSTTYHNMKEVDLGTLDWSYGTTVKRFVAYASNNADFAKSIKHASNDSTNDVQMLCAIYGSCAYSTTATENGDKCIGVADNGTVAIMDTAYTDAATFKESLSGVMLHYEATEGGEDIERKVKHVRHIEADMGTLDWSIQSGYTDVFMASISSIMKSTTNSIIGHNYEMAKTGSVLADKQYVINVSTIYVKDSSYTDAASFKTAMSGVMLYAEAATERIIDVTDLFADYPLDLIPVETGGTLTYKDSSDDGKQLATPHTVEYVVNLSEVE